MAEKMTFNKKAFLSLAETAKFVEKTAIVGGVGLMIFGGIAAWPILTAHALGITLLSGGALWGTALTERHGMNKLPGVIRDVPKTPKEKPDQPPKEEPPKGPPHSTPEKSEH